MKLLPKPLLVLMVLMAGSLSVYADAQFPDEIWKASHNVYSDIVGGSGKVRAFTSVWYKEKEEAAATIKGCAYFNNKPLLFLWGERQGSEAEGKWETFPDPSQWNGTWKAVFKKSEALPGFIDTEITFTGSHKSEEGEKTATLELKFSRVSPPYDAKSFPPPKKD